MGQYHTISAPQTGTGLDPFKLGAMLKMVEHIYNDGPKMAIALLCADGFGTHPRDLPWAPKGQWAGKLLVATGDYAEKGDLEGREDVMASSYQDIYGTTKEMPLNGRFARRKNLQSVSRGLMPIIERVANLRASDLDEHGNMKKSYCTMVPVVKTESGTAIDLGDCSPSDRQETLEYYKRVGQGDLDGLARRPLVMDNAPDWVESRKDVGSGGKALWVSLDRMEYVDCSAMNEHDLVDVVNGESARMVTTMLFHHERRGGGDMADYGPIDLRGRWRGDHIILLGSEGAKVGRRTLTQEGVLKTMRNITPLVKFSAEADSHFEKEVNETTVTPYTGTPEDQKTLRKLAGEAFKLPWVKTLVNEGADLTAELRMPVSHPYGDAIPGHFVLYLNGKSQRVWFDAKTQARMNAILDTLTPVALEVMEGERFTVLVTNNRITQSLKGLSSHEMMEIHHDAEHLVS